MSLSNKLFSMKFLVILPYLIKKVKAGRVKELIYEQLTDKRNKTPIDCIILSGPTGCLLYTSPSPRDATLSRMPSSA